MLNLADTLYFATFPDFPRSQSASLFDCSSKRGARIRASRQIKGNLADHSWANASLAHKMGKAYAKVLRQIGRCLFPPFLTLATSAEIFELWGSLSPRIVTVNQLGEAR